MFQGTVSTCPKHDHTLISPTPAHLLLFCCPSVVGMVFVLSSLYLNHLYPFLFCCQGVVHTSFLSPPPLFLFLPVLFTACHHISPVQRLSTPCSSPLSIFLSFLLSSACPHLVRPLFLYGGLSSVWPVINLGPRLTFVSRDLSSDLFSLLFANPRCRFSHFRSHTIQAHFSVTAAEKKKERNATLSKSFSTTSAIISPTVTITTLQEPILLPVLPSHSLSPIATTSFFFYKATNRSLFPRCTDDEASCG